MFLVFFNSSSCVPKNVFIRSFPSDFEIRGVFLHEFLLKRITRGIMHHIVNEQAVDEINIVALNDVFHEYRFLAIHGELTILFHPFRDVQVPSPSGLLGITVTDELLR